MKWFDQLPIDGNLQFHKGSDENFEKKQCLSIILEH